MDNEKTLAKRKIFAGAIKGAFDKVLGSAFKTLGLEGASKKIEGGMQQTSKGRVVPAKDTKWAEQVKSAGFSVSKEELKDMASLSEGTEKPAAGSKWERFMDEIGLNQKMSDKEFEDAMVGQMWMDQQGKY